MSPAITIKKVISHAFMCIALVIFPGCGQVESGVNAQNYQEIDSLMPVDLWLNSALDKLDKSPSPNSYSLVSQVSAQEAILSMLFDTSKNLKRASVKDFLGMENTLVFEDRRLAFSKHISREGASWILAYANNRPYACAFNESGHWTAIEPSDAPLNKELLNESKRIAWSYEQLEQSSDAERLIIENNLNVEGTVNMEKPLIYKVNLSEGDQIDISLNDSPNEVFFTFGNLPSSQMEYKNWNGRADQTGDLTIQVFSTSGDSILEPFNLILAVQPANPS